MTLIIKRNIIKEKVNGEFMKNKLRKNETLTGEKIADSLMIDYDDGSDGELLEALEKGDIPEEYKIDLEEILFNE